MLFGCTISDAQAGLNKCTDGKQITYTTEPCEEAGLSSAGPIKNAVTVMPLLPKTPKDPAEKPGKGLGEGQDTPPSKREVSDADIPREATIKPVSPLVNKMLN
jgi:hypothetical protein